MPPMASLVRKLAHILGIPFYRRFAAAIASVYLVMFLTVLQDISLGGRGVQFLATDWTRMFDRTGGMTFEPIAQLTLPGLTILISPVNVLIGSIVSALVGLNLAVTYMAFKQPQACGFNRSIGILASLPGLLAGGACCAPAIILILGLQVSSLFITVFQILIPGAVVLLLISLKLILDRTNPGLVSA